MKTLKKFRSHTVSARKLNKLKGGEDEKKTKSTGKIHEKMVQIIMA